MHTKMYLIGRYYMQKYDVVNYVNWGPLIKYNDYETIVE